MGWYFLIASAALGLVQLGSPLLYMQIRSWYGCYDESTFLRITANFFLPFIDPLLTYFNRKAGLFFSVFHALLEELVNRGPLFIACGTSFFRRLPRVRIGFTIASILFSILYFPFTHACPLHPFWISLILSATVLYTKSLFPACTAHVMWNISEKSYLLVFQ